MERAVAQRRVPGLMLEVILVGDVHAVPQHLEECRRLIELVAVAKADHPAAEVIFLGDQFHTNDAMSVRVMEFWRWASAHLGRPWFLVGNHDQVFPGASESSMSSCRDVANVVDVSRTHGPLLLVSYCGSPEVFAAAVAGHRGALLCHQDLAGFLYDSGTASRSTFAPPAGCAQVVSGHLHRPQESGRSWYPGAPRWTTAHDAAVPERAIWWVSFSEAGELVSRQPYSTGSACRRVVRLVDEPDQPAVLVPGADNRVEVRGDAAYIARRRSELSAEGAMVRGVPILARNVQLSESAGVAASMVAYLAQFAARIPKEQLARLVQERTGIQVAAP